jgi:hypothetical protein
MSKPPKKARPSRDQQLAADWQAVARTPEGRRIIADMMGFGWVFQGIEENDPIALSRAVGENNFAKRIARYLNLEPEVFAIAMRDNDEAAKEFMGESEYNRMMASYFAPVGKLNS